MRRPVRAIDRFLSYLFGGPEKGRYVTVAVLVTDRLAAKAVESTALTLQRVYDVHGRYRLAFGVLGVGDRVTDNVLEEHLEDAARLLVDQARDTLHTTTTGQATDRWLRDTLDVITKHLTMTLGASFAQTFTALASSRHPAATCSMAKESVEVIKIFPYTPSVGLHSAEAEVWARSEETSSSLQASHSLSSSGALTLGRHRTRTR